MSVMNVVHGLRRCARYTARFCIVCEDDTAFEPTLRQELGKTLASLPWKWRVLHLCPRCVTGGGVGTSHPVQVERFAWEKSRATRLIPKNCWLGGPTSFVVRREHAPIMADMLNTSTPEMTQAQRAEWRGVVFGSVDVVLLRMHQEHNWSFVATHPPLCMEKEQGRPTRPRSSSR